MKGRVWGYARVSTRHQKDDRQMDALLAYGVAERDIVVDHQSGKNFNRQGYLLLKGSMLRRGDTLVVKEFDRLGRDKQMVKEELEELKEGGIRVKILDLPTTLAEVDGQDWVLEMVSNILIEVIASVAQQEREKTLQRQREGIDAARARGAVFGRPGVGKPGNYEEVMGKVLLGEMKPAEAMRQMGVKRTSFYKLKKQYPVALPEGAQGVQSRLAVQASDKKKGGSL